jgi:hypothetical protein
MKFPPNVGHSWRQSAHEAKKSMTSTGVRRPRWGQPASAVPQWRGHGRPSRSVTGSGWVRPWGEVGYGTKPGRLTQEKESRPGRSGLLGAEKERKKKKRERSGPTCAGLRAWEGKKVWLGRFRQKKETTQIWFSRFWNLFYFLDSNLDSNQFWIQMNSKWI